MANNDWELPIKRWRQLPASERRRLHLEAIPRHVANSMAMEGESVDKERIREDTDRQVKRLETAKHERSTK